MISRSPEETFEFGKEYAANLKAGAIVLLEGDLGTGKTQFVKGICSYFHVKENVNSPTFVIVNEYIPQLSSKVSKIYHFDLYRIKKPEHLKEIGVHEYMRKDSICMIEWPEIIRLELPPSSYQINFFHGSRPDERKIEIQ